MVVHFFLVDRNDALRYLHELSLHTRLDLLAIVAKADALGRICEDQQKLLDQIELFKELAIEEDCLNSPFPFPSWFPLSTRDLLQQPSEPDSHKYGRLYKKRSFSSFYFFPIHLSPDI